MSRSSPFIPPVGAPKLRREGKRQRRPVIEVAFIVESGRPVMRRARVIFRLRSHLQLQMLLLRRCLPDGAQVQRGLCLAGGQAGQVDREEALVGVPLDGESVCNECPSATTCCCGRTRPSTSSRMKSTRLTMGTTAVESRRRPSRFLTPKPSSCPCSLRERPFELW